VADFNLVYTEHARRNLLAEGLHPRRIMLTGSPMREVLDTYLPQIQASDILDRLSLTDGGYFLVSAHREENVDFPERLKMLLECLAAVREKWGLPVYVSTHPRTRKRLEALPDWTEPEGIVFHEPFGFHDFNRLQLSAALRAVGLGDDRGGVDDPGLPSDQAARLDRATRGSRHQRNHHDRAGRPRRGDGHDGRNGEQAGLNTVSARSPPATT